MEKLAVICIGDELLKGAVVNTGLAAIGHFLLEYGIIPEFACEIPDTREAIEEALEFALKKADTVITSGGLGSTADDVTKEFIAASLGIRLEENGEAMRNVQAFWRMKHPGEEVPHRVFNQALVPVGAKVLQNDCGSAPGLILTVPESSEEFAGKTIVMLPGSPSELEPMLAGKLAAWVRRELKTQVFTREFRICGRREGDVEERMLPVLSRHHGSLDAAYCAAAQFVRLFIRSRNPEVMDASISEIRAEFGDDLLRDEHVSLPEEVFELLRDNDETLAVAESCTGGLVSKWMTDMPGSSEVFCGSVVSYSNEVKSSLLQVPGEILKKYGAVSRETARAMLDGLRTAIPSDAAIALTGIAGPGGASVGKPVGLVYAAVRYRDTVDVCELRLRRSREQIRAGAAAEALDHLRRMILHPAE